MNMGWGTTLITDIYFSRETFNHKDQVESKLSEIDSVIKNRESYLRELVACTEPNKMFSLDDGENAIDRLHYEVTDLISDLRTMYVERFTYKLLLDNWDNCHTVVDSKVVARSPWGKEYNEDHSYLHGDEIEVDIPKEIDSDEDEFEGAMG